MQNNAQNKMKASDIKKGVSCTDGEGTTFIIFKVEKTFVRMLSIGAVKKVKIVNKKFLQDNFLLAQ